MSLPERGTPEYAATEHRIHRRIMDTVSNIAVRRGDLPAQVHALIHDDITGEKFGSFVQVRYIGDSGMAQVTRTSIGMLAPDVTVRDIADMLVEHNPDTPLVLDAKTASELAEDSISWYENETDHCSLRGVAGGTVEVYTPFRAQQPPKDLLPPGVVSAQFFQE